MDERNPENRLGEASSKRRNTQQKEVEQKIIAGNKTERPNWSELLQDILELITARLHISDRIQSSRVCRRWRSVVVRAAPKSHPTSYGNPCLLRLLDSQKRCLLTDHLRNEHYIIQTPSIPEGNNDPNGNNTPSFREGIFMAHSNYGWMLLAEYKMTDGAIFFFNPLTQATIELPKLESRAFYTFSFSAEPTSSDCIVIGLRTINRLDSTSFYRWIPGDKEWKIFTINHQENNFPASHHKPFLSKNKIYHLDYDGRLGIYDLSDQKLIVIGELPMKVENYNSHYYNFVEMDNKIVFVYKEDSTDCRRIHLYEFDDSKKQWIKLESTRGRSLFSCLRNCIFTEAASRVEDERVYAWDLPNMEIMMSYACVMNEMQTVRKFEDDPEDELEFHWSNICWIDLKS